MMIRSLLFLLLFFVQLSAEAVLVDKELSLEDLLRIEGYQHIRLSLTPDDQGVPTGTKIVEVIYNDEGVLLERDKASIWSGIDGTAKAYDVLFVLNGDRRWVCLDGFTSVGDVSSWRATSTFERGGNAIYTQFAGDGIIGIGHENKLVITESGYSLLPTGRYHGIRLSFVYDGAQQNDAEREPASRAP